MNRPEPETDHSPKYIAKQYDNIRKRPSHPSACTQYAAYCFINIYPVMFTAVALPSLYSHIPQYTKYSITKLQLYPVAHSTFDKRYITVVTSYSYRSCV